MIVELQRGQVEPPRAGAGMKGSVADDYVFASPQ